LPLLANAQSMLFIEIEIWASSSSSSSLAVLLDLYSLMFLFSVSLITLRVFMFRRSYMQASRKFSRFHLLVVLFVTSIFLLILSPNLITLIVGWDGLGISSFFLVVFYKSNKAFNAGLVTALTNRMGDALILISLSLILPFRSFTLPLGALGAIAPAPLPLITFIVAAMTKSAQVPFSA